MVLCVIGFKHIDSVGSVKQYPIAISVILHASAIDKVDYPSRLGIQLVPKVLERRCGASEKPLFKHRIVPSTLAHPPFVDHRIITHIIKRVSFSIQ